MITFKTTKGYPRITAGPLRNQYFHRVIAAARQSVSFWRQNRSFIRYCKYAQVAEVLPAGVHSVLGRAQ